MSWWATVLVFTASVIVGVAARNVLRVPDDISLTRDVLGLMLFDVSALLLFISFGLVR